MTGNAGKRTADSRGARNSGESNETKAKPDEATSGSSGSSTTTASEDTNDDETRVMPPEVVSGAYLTCSIVDSAARPAPEGNRYYGCIALDKAHQRIDLKNVKVEFELKGLKSGLALDVPTVELADTDKDVVWQVPNDVLKEGVSADAAFEGEDGQLTRVERMCPFNFNGQQVVKQCTAS